MPLDQSTQLNRAGTIGTFERAASGDTFIFPLASEEPYRRYDGNEILVHTPAAVDLSFLNSGNAPLLDSHNRHDGLKAQIGVVERAWLDKKRLYVEVRFSRKEHAQEIMQDVIDGIVKNVSVGYTVMRTEPSENPDEYRVVRWQPTEASFVSIPADTTVGVGRSATVRTTAMPDPIQMPDPAALQAARGAETAEAIREINALAAVHNQRELADNHVDEAMRAGNVPSLAVFRGKLRAAVPADTPLVNMDIGLTQRQTERFSVMRLARSFADGGNASDAAFEREACRAAAEKDPNSSARGFVLPAELMNSWGNFEVDGVRSSNPQVRQQLGRAAISTGVQTQVIYTEHLADRFIDNLRNASSILQAGVTVLAGLDGNVEIPGGSANSAGAWLAAEAANAAETVPTFRKVTLSVKDVAGYTDITRRMLQQSSIDMEAYVRSQLITAMMEAIDLAGLSGSGAGGVPTGVKTTAGIGSVSYAGVGAIPTWAEIVAFETALASANALRGNPAYIAPASMRGYLKSTPKISGFPTFLMESNDAGLNGYRFITSNQVAAADMYFGNWSDLLMGMWGSMSLDRDTAALFLSGGVRLRAIQSVDFAVARVGSFVLGN
jgi:HK97 family phage major capsid protein